MKQILHDLLDMAIKTLLTYSLKHAIARGWCYLKNKFKKKGKK